MKKRLSLGLKLVLMTLSLVVLVVGFLLKITVENQTRDKINSAYQSQMMENRVLADNLKSKLSTHIQSLKSLASNEANLDNEEIYLNYFNSLFQNDKNLENVLVFKVNYDGKKIDQNKIFGKNNLLTEIVLNNEKYAYYWFSDRLFIGSLTEKDLILTLYNPEEENGNRGVLYSMVVPLDSFFKDYKNSILINSRTKRVIYNEKAPVKPSDYNKELNNVFLERGSFVWENKGKEMFGSFSKIGSIFLISYDLKSEVLGEVYFNIQKIILLGIIALCFSVFGIIWFTGRIVSPIESLVRATEEISKGNFDIKIEDKPNDEIGTLGSSFESMSLKMKELINSKLEAARIEQEVSIAAAVHKTLFPPTVVKTENYKMNSFFRSATECGGDLWYYFEHEGKLLIVIADATGHGLPSAFTGAGVKTSFSVLEKMIKDKSFVLTPSNVLSVANKAVYDISKGKILMTAFAMVIDLKTGDLTYSNCGHNPVWIFRSDTKKIESLTCPGNRLGQSEEIEKPLEKKNKLEDLDKILFYTDGLMENCSEEGVPFGKKEVRKIVENNYEKPGKDILGALVTEHQRVCKKNEDDLTVVIFEYKPKEVVNEN